MHNVNNYCQGGFKRILCVCSAGLLRSPTLALVLSEMGHNTRAAGSVRNFALIPVDDVLVEWAQEIVFVNKENYDDCRHRFNLEITRVVILDIPDIYNYRDKALMEICKEQYLKATNELQ